VAGVLIVSTKGIQILYSSGAIIIGLI